jgi:hypothetical protein
VSEVGAAAGDHHEASDCGHAVTLTDNVTHVTGALSQPLPLSQHSVQFRPMKLCQHCVTHACNSWQASNDLLQIAR